MSRIDDLNLARYTQNLKTYIARQAAKNTYPVVTVDKDGLMSKTDKANLDTIVNSFNSENGNTTIDTVKEVLKAFENAGGTLTCVSIVTWGEDD